MRVGGCGENDGWAEKTCPNRWARRREVCAIQPRRGQGTGYRSVIRRFGRRRPISAAEQDAQDRDRRYPRIRQMGREWARRGDRNFGREVCGKDPPPSGKLDHRGMTRPGSGLHSEAGQERKTNRHQNRSAREHQRRQDSPRACKAHPDTATRTPRRESGPSGTKTRMDRMNCDEASPATSHAPPPSSGASRSPRWRG